MSEGYGESPVEDDSIRIGEVLGILGRNKLLIALVAVLVTGLTALWIATRQPRYEARATLRLEKEEGGALSELASLGAEPAAEAEIALLQSRSLAEITVAPPRAWNPPRAPFDATQPDFDPFALSDAAAGGDALDAPPQGDPSAMDRLGLVWVVERHDLRPWRSMLAVLSGETPGEHRLRASLEPAPGAGLARELPEALDVFFVDADTVRVAAHAGFLWPAGGGAEFDFHPGEPFEACGYLLRLAPCGAYAGQRYRLQWRSDEEAVSVLLANTSAEESGRKTNVVYVTVEDCDPMRAAETANALCKNYIRRSVRIGQQKSTQTLRFIEAQLQGQQAALSEAERAVVAVQSAHPEIIALSDSATALVNQLSALQLEDTQLRLTHTALQEALGYLDDGDYRAIARLAQSLPNLLALSYITELGRLEAESLRLERTDVAGYKALLLGERQRVSGLADANRVYAGLLESTLGGLQAGEAAGLARLTATEHGGDFAGYAGQLANLDAELSRLKGALTEGNPALKSVADARAELSTRLAQQVESALGGARELDASYARLLSDYQRTIDEWPAAERGTIDGAVSALRARLRESLSAQAAGVEARSASLAGEKERVEALLGALPRSELELAEPMRQREARSQIVTFLLTSHQEAQITAAATSAGAVLIDPAVPPTARTFPKAALCLGVAAALGLLVGCALALLRNTLRGALFSEAEVERASGLSVLGSVPNYLRGRTRNPAAHKVKRFLPMRDDPNGPQAEAYRAIRAALRLAMAGEDALRTLAATSCVPGEGKTVTNADLAMVFASAGRRVLLVDSDLRKPQVHNLFGLERGPGFGEVLESKARWRDCVRTVGFPNLEVLPAGRCEALPGELLATAVALPILAELTAAYDLVVFDLPPAVVVADVASFAHKLDAVLLLYRSGGVPGRLLSAAVAKLQQANVKLIGVLLNAVYVGHGPGGYGYGYGYRYGYDARPEGEGDDETDS